MTADVRAGLWSAAATPVGAHELASVACDGDAYAYVRGVAQQAARLARATGIARDVRALLLSAAWLCWAGPGATSNRHGLDGPRAARAAGHDRLARVLAWAGGAARILGGTEVADEFALPDGSAVQVLILLDVALVTTDPAGAPAAPASVLRAMTDLRGSGDPAIAVFVGLVADLADHPKARELIAAASPASAAAAG